MSDSSFAKQTSVFLVNLEVTNNCDCCLQHERDAKSHVKNPFLNLIEDLYASMEKAGIGLSGGSKTIFLMTRDARFSQDKAPYKTCISGFLRSMGVPSSSRKCLVDGQTIPHLPCFDFFRSGHDSQRVQENLNQSEVSAIRRSNKSEEAFRRVLN